MQQLIVHAEYGCVLTFVVFFYLPRVATIDAIITVADQDP